MDGARLGLWGSSLAGGHALVAAARLGDRVAAVVAQVPHLSGVAASAAAARARGPVGALRLAGAGLYDLVRDGGSGGGRTGGWLAGVLAGHGQALAR